MHIKQSLQEIYELPTALKIEVLLVALLLGFFWWIISKVWYNL